MKRIKTPKIYPMELYRNTGNYLHLWVHIGGGNYEARRSDRQTPHLSGGCCGLPQYGSYKWLMTLPEAL